MRLTKLTKRLLDNYIDCCNALGRTIDTITFKRTVGCDGIDLTIWFTEKTISPIHITYGDLTQSQYLDAEYLDNQKPIQFTLKEIEPALLDDIILTDEEKQIIKLLIKKYNFEYLTKNVLWYDNSTIITLLMRDTNTTIDLIDAPNNIGFKLETGLFKGLVNGKEYKREDFNFLEEKENENN